MCNIATIVLNYNRYEDTIKCVDNILNLKVSTYVVIVDNASTNDSYSILHKRYDKAESIYVIKNNINSGYAKGNNMGITYILSIKNNIEYICIMNPDTSFSDGELLDKLIQKIEKRNDIAIIAPISVLNNKFSSNYMCWEIPSNKQLLLQQFITHKMKNRETKFNVDEDGIIHVEVVPGSFFIIKIEPFKRIGFFDENTFLYNEENILAIELKNIGMNEAISLGDYYFHNHGSNTQKVSLQDKLKHLNINNESRKYLCKKYYPKRLATYLSVIYFYNIIYVVIRHVKHLFGIKMRKFGILK